MSGRERGVLVFGLVALAAAAGLAMYAVRHMAPGAAATTTTTTMSTTTTNVPAVSMLDELSGKSCAPDRVWTAVRVPMEFQQGAVPKLMVIAGWGCGGALEPVVAVTTTTLPGSMPLLRKK